MHFLYDFFCCVYLSEEAAFQVIVSSHSNEPTLQDDIFTMIRIYT